MIEAGLFDPLEFSANCFLFTKPYPPAVAARAIPLDPWNINYGNINYGNNQESRGITRAAMAV